MNRTFKYAAVKRYYDDDPQGLKDHVLADIASYNLPSN